MSEFKHIEEKKEKKINVDGDFHQGKLIFVDNPITTAPQATIPAPSNKIQRFFEGLFSFLIPPLSIIRAWRERDNLNGNAQIGAAIGSLVLPLLIIGLFLGKYELILQLSFVWQLTILCAIAWGGSIIGRGLGYFIGSHNPPPIRSNLKLIKVSALFGLVGRAGKEYFYSPFTHGLDNTDDLHKAFAALDKLKFFSTSSSVLLYSPERYEKLIASSTDASKLKFIADELTQLVNCEEIIYFERSYYQILPLIDKIILGKVPGSAGLLTLLLEHPSKKTREEIIDCVCLCEYPQKLTTILQILNQHQLTNEITHNLKYYVQCLEDLDKIITTLQQAERHGLLSSASGYNHSEILRLIFNTEMIGGPPGGTLLHYKETDNTADKVIDAMAKLPSLKLNLKRFTTDPTLEDYIDPKYAPNIAGLMQQLKAINPNLYTSQTLDKLYKVAKFTPGLQELVDLNASLLSPNNKQANENLELMINITQSYYYRFHDDEWGTLLNLEYNGDNQYGYSAKEISDQLTFMRNSLNQYRANIIYFHPRLYNALQQLKPYGLATKENFEKLAENYISMHNIISHMITCLLEKNPPQNDYIAQTIFNNILANDTLYFTLRNLYVIYTKKRAILTLNASDYQKLIDRIASNPKVFLYDLFYKIRFVMCANEEQSKKNFDMIIQCTDSRIQELYEFINTAENITSNEITITQPVFDRILSLSKEELNAITEMQKTLSYISPHLMFQEVFDYIVIKLKSAEDRKNFIEVCTQLEAIQLISGLWKIAPNSEKNIRTLCQLPPSGAGELIQGIKKLQEKKPPIAVIQEVFSQMIEQIIKDQQTCRTISNALTTTWNQMKTEQLKDLKPINEILNYLHFPPEHHQHSCIDEIDESTSSTSPVLETKAFGNT